MQFGHLPARSARRPPPPPASLPPFAARCPQTVDRVRKTKRKHISKKTSVYVNKIKRPDLGGAIMIKRDIRPFTGHSTHIRTVPGALG
jgi:hypothetical protein